MLFLRWNILTIGNNVHAIYEGDVLDFGLQLSLNKL